MHRNPFQGRREALARIGRLIALPSLTTGCALTALQPGLPQPPPLPREFRAVWVASVGNIDWPSRRDLAVAQQQQEMIALLDRAAAIGLNAIILQARPSADAIYPSSLEPWSEFLTSQQGRPPDPAWDPLGRWIEEAHARGLELHAWINPFRARSSAGRGPEASSHIAVRRPDLVRRYGDQLWLDPAEADAQQHTLAVVRDLLTRYDVDGLHIDDYFYPYPIRDAAGQELDFPDDPVWQRHLTRHRSIDRAAWRREQVNRLVERLHATVRAIKPQARFGISPFGLPRPDLRPPGITGFSQYDKLFADVEGWLAAGWLDYLAPQLYWPRAQTAQAFGPLLSTWILHNPQRRAIYPGLYTSRLPDPRDPAATMPAGWSADEIAEQIALSRTLLADAGLPLGHIHFSAIALLQDRQGIASRLATDVYAEPALTPRLPLSDRQRDEETSPAPPGIELTRVGEQSVVRLFLRQHDPRAFRHAVQWLDRRSGQWRLLIVPARERLVALVPATAGGTPGVIDRIVIRSIDRSGRESPPTELVPAGGGGG